MSLAWPRRPISKALRTGKAQRHRCAKPQLAPAEPTPTKPAACAAEMKKLPPTPPFTRTSTPLSEGAHTTCSHPAGLHSAIPAPFGATTAIAQAPVGFACDPGRPRGQQVVSAPPPAGSRSRSTGRRAEDRRQLPRLREPEAPDARSSTASSTASWCRAAATRRLQAEADQAADRPSNRSNRARPACPTRSGRSPWRARPTRTRRRRSSSSTSPTTSGSTSPRRRRRATATRCSARS